MMLAAELVGEWLDLVGWVLVVLLPKPDGGRPPIGLIPALPRIWSRMRREVVAEWERSNTRSYIYWGAGMGAEVAA